MANTSVKAGQNGQRGLATAWAPLLLCLVLLAPALAYLQIASSLALGTVLTATLAIAVASPRVAPYRDTAKIQQLLLCAVLAVVIHLMLAALLRPVDFGRGLASLLPLTIILLGGVALANVLTSTPASAVRRGIQLCLRVLALIALFSIMDWLQPANIGYEKPVFPFSEPSHFAITSISFLIYACTQAGLGKRLIYLAIAITIAVLLQNLTLVVCCVVAALLCLPLPYLLLAGMAAVPALLTADISYYIARVEFNSDSQNLSALVYMQGWQLLVESLENTHGFGLGFQQLGVAGTDVLASELILALFHDHLNLLDGGFTISKIGSEFGLIGLALVAAFSVCAARAGLLLRSIALRKASVPPAVAFAASVIAGYSVELLIRGVGYFTPSGLLLVASLIVWRRYRRQLGLASRAVLAPRLVPLTQDNP